ncbi:MAG: GNAT family N-acetyltransferase, partial [Sphingobium sp.]
MATSIEAMVRLRAMTVDDLRAAQSLSNAKKWPHRVEDWDMLLSLGFGYVAESEDGIVGTAMAWLYGADAATLGMVIVSPQVSEPGVDQRLMDAVLN